MDGLCRAASSPLPIRFRDKMHLASPLRLVDFGTVEHFLLANRPSPLQIAKRRADGISLDAMGMLLQLAVDEERKLPNHVKPDEMQRYLETRDGASLAMWLMLRRHHDISFEDVDESVHDLSDEAFEKLIYDQAMVNGLTEAAERDWLTGAGDGDDDGDDDGGTPHKHKRFNWKYAVRQLCEAYTGLTPNMVGELTMYTFRELYIEAANVKGRRVSRKQWEEEQRKKAEASKASNANKGAA